MIFVDVGAHEGQTLQEVVRYDFNHIYAFEPMPTQFKRLKMDFGGWSHVELINAGLGKRNGKFLVYGENDEMEASIFPEKEDVNADVVTKCRFIRASSFFEDLPESAFVKLNCEGSEVHILNDLIDSGEIWKIQSVLVDFDVRRIPGMEDEEQAVLKRLGEIGFDRLLLCEDAVPNGRERRMEGTYRYTRREEIMCWLKSLGVGNR